MNLCFPSPLPPTPLVEPFDQKDSHFSFIVPPSHENRRLDITVAAHNRLLSRTAAADLIDRGIIRVGGEEKKPSFHVHSGDEISGHIPSLGPIQCKPEPICLDILFEDEHLTVVNKPPGMVVHPAPGNWTGTLVAGLLYRSPELSDISTQERPGIVHRLDRNTSGVLITTKTPSAQNSLMEQFKSRSVQKRYFALVHGVLPSASGIVDLPIGRHPMDRKRMATGVPRSREAHTEWRVLNQFPNAAFLNVSIKTGRTHQIRVHMQAIGHPVAGDTVYGKKYNGLIGVGGDRISVVRQMLHAREVRFLHPVTLEVMRIVAPMPFDMESLLKHLGDTNERD